MTLLRLLFIFLFATLPAWAGTPPVVDDAAQARADRISAMPDGDPAARINQLLAARELDQAALFALAATHPGIVQQIVDDRYKLAVDYLATLPAPELYKIRRGDTVIRSQAVLRGAELQAATALADQFNFKHFKPEKIGAVRVGPLEARVYRVEVTYQRNKDTTESGVVELAWPSTPDRDERCRTDLTRHFGARPSRTARGVGAVLPLQNGSFESAENVAPWQQIDGLMLGTNTPVQDVSIDDKIAVDGIRSVRFFATDKTRLFPELVQQVPVPQGHTIRVRAHFRADKLRVEYLQREDNVHLAVIFVDAAGAPVGSPAKSVGRLSTHAWELLEVTATVPPGATAVQVGLLSAVSGTSWFDGVLIEVVD